MEQEIESLKIENKEKEDALIELSQFYNVSKYICNIFFILLLITIFFFLYSSNILSPFLNVDKIYL